MRLCCNKADLLAVVTPATYVASTKNTGVASAGAIHLKAEGETLTLSAYDMEKGIRATVPAKVYEAGAYIIDNPQKLGQILRLIGEGDLTMEVENGSILRLTSGKSTFELCCKDGKQFSILPELSGERGFTVPQKVLRRMLAQVNFAVAQNDHRVVLQGTHFEIRDDKMRLVACDGHRLAIKDRFADIENRSMDGTGLNLNFTVPGKALSELSKMLGDNEEGVTIILGRKHVIFSMGNIKFFTRMIDGEYIDYHRFVPAEFRIHAELNTDDLLSALERASLITEDRAAGQVRSIVCLKFEDEFLSVSSTSISGKAYDEIAIDKTGDELLIGFNCRMLLDVVRACSAERVVLDLNTALTSMVIRPAVAEDGEDFLFLCLPVQMRD